MSEKSPQLAFSECDDTADVFLCYPKFISQNALQHIALCVPLPYFGHLSRCESCSRMFFAKRVTLFLSHILQVFLECSKEKVVGIYAFWIVALMANAHVIWNWPDVQFVGNAMSLSALIATQLDLPIAFAVKCALPLPTIIRAALIYFFPEAFSQWAMRRWLVTANILTLPARKLRWRDFLTTATFTQNEERELQLRVTRGMLCHVNSPFATLTTPRDDSTHRRGNFIGLTLLHFSTFERVNQPIGGAL